MSMAAEKFKYVHDRFDAYGVTEDERIYVLREDVAQFIYKCQQWNDAPNIRQFLADHEEWDHDRYLDTIEAEFKRVQNL